MTIPEPSAEDRFAHSLSAGVYRAPPALAPEPIRTAMETSGLATFTVDLETAGGKAGILDAFATGLDFPAWVGRNWDALDDAMRDLSWAPSGVRGRAVLVRGAVAPSAGSRSELELLEDVLGTAVARWAGTDKPLVVVHAR
ncbi:MAG: barstar family protein [Chloroflexota bacterium]|jgi:hypothetical protein